MKFDFFRKNKEHDKTGCDCACGCCDEARESVRLTDAEIAEDITVELRALEEAYSQLCKTGCNFDEKLRSCERSRQALCEFTHGDCK